MPLNLITEIYYSYFTAGHSLRSFLPRRKRGSRRSKGCRRSRKRGGRRKRWRLRGERGGEIEEDKENGEGKDKNVGREGVER